MTSITIDRFRRFETILHAITDPTTAKMATNLASVFTEADGTKPNLIPWRSLADRYSQSGEALQNILTETDTAARNGFGFPLLARGARTYFMEPDEFLMAEDEDSEIAAISFSKEFTAILTGAAAPQFWAKRGDVPELKPDDSSMASVTLVRNMARAGGAPFLYRRAESEDALRHLEMTGLADALATDDDVPVYVAATPSSNPGEGLWTADPPLASLLSAVLHLPNAAIILFPFADQLANEELRLDDEEENLYAPSMKASRPRMLLTHQAKIVIRLLPHLTQTVIFTLPAEAALPMNAASAFAGALRPLRPDRVDRLQRAITAIPGKTLSIATAERLLDSMIDPRHAQTLLTAAKRLSEQPQAEECPRGQDDKDQNRGFDTLVTRLASSMAPVIDGTARTRPKRAECFDPELFPSDPDMADYFAHADELREAGAKFLIHGQPGSGKTAIASELARRLKLSIKEIRGSDVFGRWWGTTERLIRRTFEEAAGKGNVLLFFDEADALFADRARDDSNKHLAVAATSEFLKYLDAYEGSVIAATNFLADIDKAIIRRFDIVVGTATLPEEREILAWQRILALNPPSPFRPLGGTVVADYVLTKRRLTLLNRREPYFALQTLREVRDARGGENKPQYGFLT